MSDKKTRPGSSGNNEGSKRNLPSWMSSRENQDEGHGKNPTRNGEDDKSSEVETPKKAKGQKDRTLSKQIENDGSSSVSGSESRSFSKLLNGVVFVLSGFVNPERSILRSQALEMGAEYQPDWNSDCTLLVCAFPNTPKFRQVEADCGTIVSKDWISECYSQRKLIDIESYLMHVGKPWRKGNKSDETTEGKIKSPTKKSKKHDERGLPSKLTASTKPKGKDLDPGEKLFPSSEVKNWAIDDLNRTIQWLESQDEKPDPSEITKIAAEGILTCLQDVICAVEGKQDVSKATEEWNFVPRVVEELAKCDVSGNKMASLSKEDLHRVALDCKRIYEVELNHSDDELKKKLGIDENQRSNNGKTKSISSVAAEYDSDETIEMTEDEIDLAYKTLSSNICKS